MLTHIVIWKYRDDVESATREEHVAQLARLAGVIPEIVSLKVGFDVLGLPRSFHTGLVVVFRDRTALEAYTVHPAHQMVVQFGSRISEQVASVDFQSEDERS